MDAASLILTITATILWLILGAQMEQERRELGEAKGTTLMVFLGSLAAYFFILFNL